MTKIEADFCKAAVSEEFASLIRTAFRRYAAGDDIIEVFDCTVLAAVEKCHNAYNRLEGMTTKKE